MAAEKNGYSHSWADFQEIIAEARKRGFKHSTFPCIVETGTFLGQTIIPIAHHFKEVHTIEIKPECFEAAKLFSWKARAPINFHRGASEELLSSIVARLKRPTIFYLDAHYSGGISGGEDHDVPLLRELYVISRTYRMAGLIIIDDLDLFGRVHRFDDDRWVDADWCGITEEAVRACFVKADRIACTFAVPEKNCYVIGLAPTAGPPNPPPDFSLRVAVGGTSTEQAHWVSQPGRPLDLEALMALRRRGSGWNDVANLIALEYEHQRVRSGRAHPGAAPKMDTHVAAGTWNQWNSDEAHHFQDPAVAQRPAAPQPALPPTPAESGRKQKPKVVLTREQALDMEQELARRFEDPGFQQKLRAAWAAAGGDGLKQMQARMEVCLPIQTEVIPKYGFEPTRRGVAQSVHTVRALFMEDQEIMSVADYLTYLVDPTHDGAQWVPFHS